MKDRLDDDRRDRVVLALEELRDRVAGEGDVLAVEEDARVRAAEYLDAAERGRADGVAVERAVERDERSSSRLTCTAIFTATSIAVDPLSV